MFSKTNKPMATPSSQSKTTPGNGVRTGAAAQSQRQAATGSAPPAKAGQGVPSLISADLTIIGNLISTGDLQIDGRIEGDVESQSLTVGETAQVKGTLKAAQVRVSGKMDGVIRGRHVELTQTARVKGDVVHDDLTIEAGAHIVGEVRRSDAPLKEKPAPITKAAATPPPPSPAPGAGPAPEKAPAAPAAAGGEKAAS
jgi:cytoskeletal protein CcmA (bactofilin family)